MPKKSPKKSSQKKRAAPRSPAKAAAADAGVLSPDESSPPSTPLDDSLGSAPPSPGKIPATESAPPAAAAAAAAAPPSPPAEPAATPEAAIQAALNGLKAKQEAEAEAAANARPPVLGVSFEFFRDVLVKHPGYDKDKTGHEMMKIWTGPKSATRAKKCSLLKLYKGQSSQDSQGAPAKPYVGPATVFVSHAYQYNFLNATLDAIGQWAHHDPNAYFYIDIVCHNYFSDDGDDHPGSPAESEPAVNGSRHKKPAPEPQAPAEPPVNQ